MAGRTAAMHQALGELARREDAKREDARRRTPDSRSSDQRLRLVARRVPGQRAAAALGRIPTRTRTPAAMPAVPPAVMRAATHAATRRPSASRRRRPGGWPRWCGRLWPTGCCVTRATGPAARRPPARDRAVRSKPRDRRDPARPAGRANRGGGGAIGAAGGPRRRSSVVAPVLAVLALLAAAATAVGIEAALVALAWRAQAIEGRCTPPNHGPATPRRLSKNPCRNQASPTSPAFPAVYDNATGPSTFLTGRITVMLAQKTTTTTTGTTTECRFRFRCPRRRSGLFDRVV